MLPSWCHQTVLIRRAVLRVDRYGNSTAVRAWDDAVDTAVAGVSVQPVTGDEVVDRRNAVLLRFSVFFPPGTDIQATDRVVYGGLVYEVVEDVRRWSSATGGVDFVRTVIRRVEG